MPNCPCQSNNDFSSCCEPYITGNLLPETPAQLMRSRYTAYTLANIDYIQQTMRGKAAENYDAAGAKQWASSIEWLGLSVINTHNNEVTFIARFKSNGKIQCIYECSQFERVHDRWFYTSGYTPKVKRNDPCPCQSGKKAKRCCFNA